MSCQVELSSMELVIDLETDLVYNNVPLSLTTLLSTIANVASETDKEGAAAKGRVSRRRVPKLARAIVAAT